VNGKAEHGDSLGTKSTIGPGGIQVMQTGSGVSHEEAFIGPDFDDFKFGLSLI
jgi:redox-sensitive bicupin YhaK (pirin superfamily)